MPIMIKKGEINLYIIGTNATRYNRMRPFSALEIERKPVIVQKNLFISIVEYYIILESINHRCHFLTLSVIGEHRITYSLITQQLCTKTSSLPFLRQA